MTRLHILVEVEMPHLSYYGRPTVKELTYACDFPVTVGDVVVCPSPPLGNGPLTGIVTSLTSDYDGPVRPVSPLRTQRSRRTTTQHAVTA